LNQILGAIYKLASFIEIGSGHADYVLPKDVDYDEYLSDKNERYSSILDAEVANLQRSYMLVPSSCLNVKRLYHSSTIT
jgi:hypothetical protein